MQVEPDAKVQTWAKDILDAKIPHGDWAQAYITSGYEWRNTLYPLSDGLVRDRRTCFQIFQYPATSPTSTILTLQPSNGFLIRIKDEHSPLPKGENLILHDLKPTAKVEYVEKTSKWEVRRFWFLSLPIEKPKIESMPLLPSLGLFGM